MKFKFNKYHFKVFIALFAIEAAIAYFLKSGFIRHTFGDFLVVILVYCFLRSFIQTKPLYIAIVTLTIAFSTEFLQRTTFLEVLGLKHNTWANLIFGNSFSVEDLIAYTLGVLVILFIDQCVKTNRFII